MNESYFESIFAIFDVVLGETSHFFGGGTSSIPRTFRAVPVKNTLYEQIMLARSLDISFPVFV